MTAETIKDAVGKALYLEMRKDQYTYQIILTPHSLSFETKEIIAPAYIRRRVSVWHPRRNWQIDKFAGSDVQVPKRDADGNFEAFDSRIAVDAYAESVFKKFSKTFENLASQGWTLYKRPIAVEISAEDLDSISKSKMSNALYRRIERSRKSFGWEDSLFNPEVVIAK